MFHHHHLQLSFQFVCSTALLLLSSSDGVRGFAASSTLRRRTAPATSRPVLSSSAAAAATTSTTTDTAVVTEERPAPTEAHEDVDDNEDDGDDRSVADVKRDLLDLLTTHTFRKGTSEDDDYDYYAAVQDAVNRLEARYVALETPEFFDFAVASGAEWTWLFSTDVRSSPDPRRFRVRALRQTVDASTSASMTTTAVWDLAPHDEGRFTCSGTLDVTHSYAHVPGGSSRVALTLREDATTLRLARGSSVPPDVPRLMGYLQRSVPPGLWNATRHMADTTYLDESLRIVRYTTTTTTTGDDGSSSPSPQRRLEGVRDIFWRDVPSVNDKHHDDNNNHNNNHEEEGNDSSFHDEDQEESSLF